MAFPGRRSVVAAASDGGRRAAQVMAGVVIMLAAAGLLEGFARQLVTDPVQRAVIGATMLLIWLSLFVVVRPRPEDSPR